MKTCINRCMLLGLITPRGIELRYSDSGTPVASFAVEVQDQGKDGSIFSTYVPVEVVGRGAEAAGELQPGTLVVIDQGWLKWRRDGDGGRGGTIVVATWQVQPLVPMVPHVAPRVSTN